MSGIIALIYTLLIIIYIAMGAAIVFHMLHYKINRHVATIMFFVYTAGGIILLISNFVFFSSVNWYQFSSNFGF
jgi:hypothetical protein